MQWTYTPSMFHVYQANHGGDGGSRVGSESDVVDYVETRIKLSLEKLSARAVDGVEVYV